MRKQTWMRFGLASVIMTGGAAAVLAVGCGGDDNVVNQPDSSTHPDTGFGDVQAPDSPVGNEGGGNDSGDAGGPKHAKIIAVHASAYAPAFRFCFAVGTKDDGSDGTVGPLPALPHDDSNLPAGVNYPGLYPGTGGAFPDLTDLEPKSLTPYLIPMPNAKIAGDVKSAGAAERTCDTLIGAAGAGGVATDGGPAPMVLGTDYFKLPTIPKGTFVKGKTLLLGLAGCMPGNTSAFALAQCGASYPVATGNLNIKIFTLDKVVADPAKMGLQVLDLSQAIDGIVGAQAGGTVTGIVGIDLVTRDGGSPANAPVGTTVKYGDFLPAAAAPQTYTVAQYLPSVAYDKLIVTNGDGGMFSPKTIALPFGVIQTLTYGRFGDAGLPGPMGTPIYVPGANFTLVILGDPSATHQLTMDSDAGPVADPQYDGRGVHMVMFPNDPPLPSL